MGLPRVAIIVAGILALVPPASADLTGFPNSWTSTVIPATRINPTDRTIAMVVPLRFKKFQLGDVPIRISPHDEISVAKSALARVLKRLLRREAFEQVSSLPAAEDRLDLRVLYQAGFDISFDQGQVALVFKPTIEQKVKGSISVDAQGDGVESPNNVDPSTVSGYVNVGVTMDYISESAGDNIGMTPPRLDFDGAVRLWDFVLEGEATYEPEDISVFQGAGSGFKRRGTRIVKDFPDAATRIVGGDVYPLGASFQTVPDLLGISVLYNVNTFEPGRSARPTGRRSFRIERTSSVDIIVNGQIIKQLRLDPGDYDIDDFPFSSGANDVRIVIKDDAGREQVINFSLFLDGALLTPGTKEWAVAAGVRAEVSDGEPDYQYGDPVITGFYRQGIFENLSGAVHAQVDSKTAMAGLSAILGTTIGLFAVEVAGSYAEGSGVGAALNIDYQATFEDLFGVESRLRLSAEAYSETFGTIGDEDFFNSRMADFSVSYSRLLPFDVAASFTGYFTIYRDGTDDAYGVDARLSRSFAPAISIGITGGYFGGGDKEEGFRGLFRVGYRLDEDSDLSSTYDALDGTAQLSYYRAHGRGIGSWSTNITADYEKAYADEGEDIAALNGGFNYTGNRFTASVSHDRRFAGLTTEAQDQRTSLRVQSGIAFADGHVAVGRPISSGFAIVTQHPSLEGRRVYMGSEDDPVSYSDLLGPALVSSLPNYSQSRIAYDVHDLPVGYDLGTGTFDMVAPYKAGYAVTVGSSYTVTVFGILHDADGNPIPLLTGTAQQDDNEDKQVALFTNRAGRFAAQGLAPGKWTIDMATEPKTHFVLDIPEDTVGLYKAETLTPAGGSQ